MHSVGLNVHGNPHLTARDLQQPEPTAPVNPIPSSDDGDEDSSFGAAVNVTLSANAKAHMAMSSEEGGKGNKMNSTAHRARPLMQDESLSSLSLGNLPFGKIVSQVARFGLDGALAFFSAQVVPEPVEETGEGESTEAAGELLPAVPVEDGVEGDEGGEVTAEVALAPAPLPPLEDLLLEEGLLGQTTGDAETDLLEDLLDPDVDGENSLTV